MIDSIAKTLGQLGDRRLRGVLMMAIALSLALIAAIAFAVGLVLSMLATTGMVWLDELIAWFGAIGTAILALVFFPGAVQIVSGLFLDRVAAVVEDRHFQDLGPARDQPMTEIVLDALRFAGLSIGLNILALPLYLILPGFNLLIFYALNGYLLGREYADMVGTRRMDKEERTRFRRANRGAVFSGGVVIAALSTVPILNLATPVLATAFAVHEHERLRRRTIPR